jgi:alkane 1-monooxygenase
MGNYYGGWWVASNAVFSLLILAILESFVSENKSNEVDQDIYFPDFLLQIHVTMQLAIIFSIIYTLNEHTFSIAQLLLLSLSIGINSGGSAIVIAHELIHRKNKYFRFLGKLLLLTTCNIYFYVDHLRIHHKWVGTAKDHATARLGENLYSFFIRSVCGQLASSWELEKKRLSNSAFIVKLTTNYLTASLLLILLICSIFYLFSGWFAVFVFLLQAFFANFLLEYTNYIEHYGLSRKENERVTELHSWQSDKVISRYFLIDLSRHADHHYFSSKPYHTLRTYSNAPVLPGGYVQMIFYALIPPLWFSMVHKTMKNSNQVQV